MLDVMNWMHLDPPIKRRVTRFQMWLVDKSDNYEFCKNQIYIHY